jgi:hypothetical protein
MYESKFSKQFSKSANHSNFFADQANLIFLSKACQQFSKSVSCQEIVSANLFYKQFRLQTSAA